MDSGRYRGAGRPLAQTAGIALIAALLAACGGGGGGGGTSSTGTGGAGGTGGTGGVDPNATGTCPASQNASANGFTLGVCQTSTATTEINDAAFKDLSPAVVNNGAFTAQSYTLTVPTLVTANLNSGAHETCRNLIGSLTGLAVQDPPGPPIGAPLPSGLFVRTYLSSFAQTSALATGPGGCARTGVLNLPAIGLRSLDFGTFEHNASTTTPPQLYYGGWYATRGAQSSLPQRVVAFDGGGSGAVAQNGVAVGYVFSNVSSFSMSGAVRNVRFTPSSSTEGRVSGTIDQLFISRQGAQLQTVSNSLSFDAPVDSAGRFTGPLTGTVQLVAGNASGTLQGRIEGAIVRNAADNTHELAGRLQGRVDFGSAAPTWRIIGSMAIAE